MSPCHTAPLRLAFVMPLAVGVQVAACLPPKLSNMAPNESSEHLLEYFRQQEIDSQHQNVPGILEDLESNASVHYRDHP